MQQNKLALIIPTMNAPILEDLFKSILAQLDETAIAVFVAIEIPDRLVQQYSDEHAVWIHVPNHGYAAAVNRGIEEAIKQGANQFCVMNDDTYVQSGFIGEVSRQLNTHPHCLIGGKIYYAPGYEYHKERYSEDDRGIVFWYAGGSVQPAHATTTHRGVDEVDTGQYDIPQLTEFITGCLMAFDKSVVDTIGLWDESYFLYYEDADYCERAKKKQIALWYCPEIKLWHKVSQSTGGSGSSLHVNYQRKNRLRWSMKYMPLRTTIHLVKRYIADLLFQH